MATARLDTEHFTEDVIGKAVVDAHGEELGRIAAVDEGVVRIELD